MSYTTIADIAAMERICKNYSQMSKCRFPEPKPYVSTNYAAVMCNATFGMPPSEKQQTTIETKPKMDYTPSYKSSQTSMQRMKPNSDKDQSSYIPCYINANEDKGIISTPCEVPNDAKVLSVYTLKEVSIGPIKKNTIECDAPEGNPNHGKMFHVINKHADDKFYIHRLKFT